MGVETPRGEEITREERDIRAMGEQYLASSDLDEVQRGIVELESKVFQHVAVYPDLEVLNREYVLAQSYLERLQEHFADLKTKENVEE